MLFEMRMPKLTETLTDVKIHRWLIKEGERVRKGQTICEVETDKVTIVIESQRDGIIQKLLFKEGEEVPMNEVIVFIDESI